MQHTIGAVLLGSVMCSILLHFTLQKPEQVGQFGCLHLTGCDPTAQFTQLAHLKVFPMIIFVVISG